MFLYALEQVINTPKIDKVNIGAIKKGVLAFFTGLQEPIMQNGAEMPSLLRHDAHMELGDGADQQSQQARKLRTAV